MSYYISNVRLKNIKKTISRINKSIVTLFHTRKNINKALNKLDHAVNHTVNNSTQRENRVKKKSITNRDSITLKY